MAPGRVTFRSQSGLVLVLLVVVLVEEVVLVFEEKSPSTILGSEVLASASPRLTSSLHPPASTVVLLPDLALSLEALHLQCRSRVPLQRKARSQS
jgi:hypothetical protein